MKNRKAVRVLPLLLFLCAGLLMTGNFAPASANAQQAITGKVKRFYSWYVAELHRDDRSPLDNRAMIRNHSSRRLWSWITSEAYADFGADYFLAAQDYTRDWGTHFKFSNFKTKGNIATFTMRLGRPKASKNEMGPHTLKLKMVKEGGSWKIDRVNGN